MKISTPLCCLLLLSILYSCREYPQRPEAAAATEQDSLQNGLNPENFETEINGRKTRLLSIANENGITASFTNYGQRLVSLYVPDKMGKLEDIVLGFPDLEGYRKSEEKFFGATIGQYGNRIAEGEFELDGKTYSLEKNNNGQHLHGGTDGFHNVVWDMEKTAPNQVVFSRVSPDMEEGYPGNLSVKTVYTLTEENELKIEYKATTDTKTPVNLTHHSFFNLAGAGNGDINDHILMINADSFTPVDEHLIPTGELKPVAGTPFDFTSPKAIGEDLEAKDVQLEHGKGYDHNFVLNAAPRSPTGLVLAARVVEPGSGRTLEVYTDEPGLQFYGGNFLDGSITGKEGKTYGHRGSFCLETQHFPDSPNQPEFPEVLLEPGEEYSSTCIYKFGVQTQEPGE